MARVGLKGAWLEAARLSRHRAHSLLSRVFVATKERTCVLLCDVSSSSSSSSNDNPPNDEWTERIIIPWKREEEERRQRHLHHLFVCVIFFISFHLQCVSLRVSECVFADLCATTEFLSLLFWSSEVSVCVSTVRVCVCVHHLLILHCETRRKRRPSLSLSLARLCVSAWFGLSPKKCFLIEITCCTVCRHRENFPIFSVSGTHSLSPFSHCWCGLLLWLLLQFGDFKFVSIVRWRLAWCTVCQAKEKRREKKKKEEAQWGSPTPHTHTQNPLQQQPSSISILFLLQFALWANAKWVLPPLSIFQTNNKTVEGIISQV